MKYRIYTRQEYLQWCQDKGVKTLLPEYKRNKFTISGYPTYSYDENF